MADRETPVAPDYKRLTYPQLRSFCQVARAGSMKAAADSLGVAQPTVWKQIHAMEKSLGVSLVHTGRGGTKLTQQGRLLLQLCGPAVNDIDSLEVRFQQATSQKPRDLTIAASPRVCHEDLPPVISPFRKSFPDVRLRFRELAGENVVAMVESGVADIGLADIGYSVVPEELEYRHCYNIVPVVAIPSQHPLAKRSRVRLEDIARFPILNAPDSFPSEQINLGLRRAGAYERPERHIELQFAQTILRYVALGHGIGIIGHPEGWTQKPPRGVVEKQLSGSIEMLPVHAVYRRKAIEDNVEQGLISLLATRNG